MDFRFTDDQLLFAESVRDYLSGTHGPEVLRRLDELERRIHLSALAVAVPVGVVVLMCAGLLVDWMDAGARHATLRFAWAALPIAYGGCYAVVRRRYA